MAIIQMINEEVLDVTQSGEDIYGATITAAHPMIQLTAKDDNGEHNIWVNIGQISSFMG
jgi:hypothetical protein